MDRSSMTINERLANPVKLPRLFEGNDDAMKMNRPRHFGKAALAIMESYQKENDDDDKTE